MEAVHEPATHDGETADDKEAVPILLVEEITDELKAAAEGPSAGGRGGMLTKLEAAQIAMQAGGVCVIANGKTPEILDRIVAGEQNWDDVHFNFADGRQTPLDYICSGRARPRDR
ncbi:MAG: hypothetical protein M3410_15125 [Acidobacteriota bacterium]|nr:hypothetical protein [Acidobacteriota bacterium]